jgi:hypothetical protein
MDEAAGMGSGLAVPVSASSIPKRSVDPGPLPSSQVKYSKTPVGGLRRIAETSGTDLGLGWSTSGALAVLTQLAEMQSG